MKFFVLILTLIVSIFNVFEVEAYNKSIFDITKLSINEINDYIDQGYLTYEQLTQIYLDRIEEYNDKYNAIISINEQALEQAKKCDEIYQKEGRKSLLFGIPIILKDNIDYVDLPTTGGTLALKDSYPYENALIVQNLINNGAIILAKANMSEFAFSAKNSYSSYGNVKNAYNINYTPYGSSGGSAVAVAASFAPISIGTDTNSSVRLPASANNLIGLRPTQGLLSNKGIIAYDITRDTAGPISKTVEDNAILLTILANNNIDYTQYLKKDGLQGKKIGVLTQFIEKDKTSNMSILNSEYDEIKKLMYEAIDKMEKAGAKIIYIDDFYNSKMNSYYSKTMFDETMCYQFNQYIKDTSSKIKSFSDLLNNGGYVHKLSNYNISCNYNLLNTSSYKNIEKYRSEYQKIVEEKMELYDVDVLIYPNSKNKLPKISELDSISGNFTSYTISPSTGFPAIAIPLGFDSDGLPYGFEILAKSNQENLLYEIAYSYEQLDNNLITPDIAPSLYDIPNVLLDLKSLYENTPILSQNENFITTVNKVRNLLFNYNNFEGNDADIEQIYNEYKLQIENEEKMIQEKIIMEQNSKKINKIIIITISFILFAIYIVTSSNKKTE